MSMPKPETIGELYLFFFKGLPREPTKIAHYTSLIRRKGWNILTISDWDNWELPMSYYSNWEHDNPEWTLHFLKYK